MSRAGPRACAHPAAAEDPGEVTEPPLVRRVLALAAAALLLLAAAPSLASREAPGAWARAIAAALSPPPLPPMDGASGTPIHDALRAENSEAFLAALDAGADPNVLDENGDTALHLAAARLREESVLALLFMGADPRIENAEGQVPLHSIMRSPGARRHSGRVDAIRDHLRRHAFEEPAMPSAPFAQAAFVVAVAEGKEPLLRWSVRAGADVDWPLSGQGDTALHLSESAETAAWLIGLGADLEAKDARGATPLIDAAAAQRRAVLRVLIDAGARVDVRDEAGRSALGRALASRGDEKRKTVRLLLGEQPPIGYRELALARHDRLLMKLLFDHGASIHPQDGQAKRFVRGLRVHEAREVRAFLMERPDARPTIEALERELDHDERMELLGIWGVMAPYLFLFGLFLTAVPFGLAIALWTFVPRPVPHALLTAVLSSLAIALAFFPRETRESLASARYIDTPLTFLPHLLTAIAVALIALSALLIAPVVFVGLRRSGKLRRGGHSALVAGTSSLGFFLLLLGHNVERIELLDRLPDQIGRLLG